MDTRKIYVAEHIEPVEEGRINGAGDVPVTNAAAVAVAEGDDENHDWRKACGPLKVLERRFSRLANVKTPIIDSGDLPVNCKWVTFMLYILGVIFAAAYFFSTNYIKGRTESFITLDKTSGVCKDEPGSTECCEVPVSVTGYFLADSTGKWNSEPGFTYNDNLYGTTMTALQYTNDEWRRFMKNIQTQLAYIGKTKGANRDFAWNLIAWSSFSAISETDKGYLRFYATGDAAQIFDKEIIIGGFASEVIDDYQCDASTTFSYQAASRLLTVNTELNTGSNCADSTSGYGYTCENPCPRLLNPKVMISNTYGDSIPSTTMTLKFDMASVVTALAVNLGILPLSNLEEFADDTNREDLLGTMLLAGLIDEYTFNHTSSYFEFLYAPMNSIYCTNYSEINTAACYVRSGRQLFYPVINSYGWVGEGGWSDPPNRCNAKENKANNPYAIYYCNLFDIVVGMIYYPNLNESLSTAYSFNPTDATAPIGLDGITSTAGQTQNRRPHSIKTPPASFRQRVAEIRQERKALNRARAALKSQREAEWLNGDIGKTPSATDDHLHTSTDDLTDDYTTYTYADDDDSSGGGSYYYSSSGSDDDAVYSFETDYLDNGKIFDIGKFVAKQVNRSIAGDTFISRVAFNASITALYGASWGSTAKNDFSELCSHASSNNQIESGCAMFAIEFYGGEDRTISEFEYQPGGGRRAKIAFANTLYNKVAMDRITKEPPTRLTQEYYSCVLSEWNSFFQASGLAASNTQLYVAIVMLTYLYVIVHIMRRWHGHDVRWKLEKQREEEMQKEMVHEVMLSFIQDIKNNTGTKEAAQTIAKLDAFYEKKGEEEKKKAANWNGMIKAITGSE